MLTTPTKGFARSVSVHNVRLDAMAEWIEGCVTFSTPTVSMVDVKDQLHEEDLYPDQDYAQQRIDDVWLELRRRAGVLGVLSPFAVESTRVRRVLGWQDAPAYSFCLMLALQVAYRPTFRKQFGSDYTQQGALFEELTAEALRLLGLRTHSTGWSHTASASIEEKVRALAAHLGEDHRVADMPKWTNESAKDGGLDVVCHMPFCDGRAGRPIFFVQCASGEDWLNKRHTPNLDLWGKLLDLTTKPRRGIAHPFALLHDDFRKTSNYDCLAIVLDRHRLCRPSESVKIQWVSPDLTKRVNGWTKSRLKALMANRT